MVEPLIHINYCALCGKSINDDYITSYNKGWLCGGDENKTVFKSYYFDKIIDIFVNQE